MPTFIALLVVYNYWLVLTHYTYFVCWQHQDISANQYVKFNKIRKTTLQLQCKHCSALYTVQVLIVSKIPSRYGNNIISVF